MSATAGQSPHELSYLGPLLARAAGAPSDDLDGFRALMKRLKIGRAKGRWKNWSWEPNESDRKVMADLLYRGAQRDRPASPAGGDRRLAGGAARAGADRARCGRRGNSTRRPGASSGASSALPAARRASPQGWAADLRFRQKASLLRIAGTTDFVDDLLGNDEQVAVSVAFLETSAMLADSLRGHGWAVGEINGEHSGVANEETRLAFQTGKLDAVIFTVTESISLHRGEMPGGERERSLVIHDMRHSAIQLQQIEGRCHRDGQHATIFYAYAEDTVEEAVAGTVIAAWRRWRGWPATTRACWRRSPASSRRGRLRDLKRGLIASLGTTPSSRTSGFSRADPGSIVGLGALRWIRISASLRPG